MKREIKFRGRNVKHGWLTGYYFVNRGVHFIVEDGIADPLNTWEDYAVDPGTVGQYTGLKDKDGKEIYEGDIIGGSNGSINGYEWPFKLLIKWNDERCGFNTPAWGYLDSTHYYDVIGNIHDNPELLEDGK